MFFLELQVVTPGRFSLPLPMSLFRRLPEYRRVVNGDLGEDIELSFFLINPGR